MTKRPEPHFTVRVTGDLDKVKQAREVIDRALLAAGYTNEPPTRHLRVVDDYHGRAS